MIVSGLRALHTRRHAAQEGAQGGARLLHVRAEVLLDEDHADVREYAAGLSDNEKAALYLDAAKQGMEEMSKKFRQMRNEVYVDAAAAVKESNRAL